MFRAVSESNDSEFRWAKRNAKNTMVLNGKLFGGKEATVQTVPQLQTELVFFFCLRDEPGHLGQSTSSQFVFDRFWWLGMQRDIYQFVHSCFVCQCFQPVSLSNKSVHTYNQLARMLFSWNWRTTTIEKFRKQVLTNRFSVSYWILNYTEK